MNDCLNIKVEGMHVVDKITYVKTGKVEVIDRGHNLVVNKVLPLIMGMLKGSLSGIQYWAIGSGSSSWDSNPVSPTLSETKLTKEIVRKAVTASEMKYVDPKTYVESSSPTTCLQISTTYYENEGNGAWREFGLFGGNATSAKDSGFMIDKKHHAILTKTNEMVVERKIFLTISFS